MIVAKKLSLEENVISLLGSELARYTFYRCVFHMKIAVYLTQTTQLIFFVDKKK